MRLFGPRYGRFRNLAWLFLAVAVILFGTGVSRGRWIDLSSAAAPDHPIRGTVCHSANHFAHLKSSNFASVNCLTTALTMALSFSSGIVTTIRKYPCVVPVLLSYKGLPNTWRRMTRIAPGIPAIVLMSKVTCSGDLTTQCLFNASESV